MRLTWTLGLVLLAACAQEITVGVDGGGGAPDSTGMQTQSDAAPGGSDADPSGQDATPAGADAGVADATQDSDGGMTMACSADPFVPCMDPDEIMSTDNEWPDATRVSSTSIGCKTGDDVTPLDFMTTGFMCANDPADWYQVTMVCCDTRTLIGEIIVRPTVPCAQSEWTLTLNGHDCDGGDPNVRCMEDGDAKSIQVLIPPCGVVFSWYWGIEKESNYIRLDYEMTFTLQ